MYTNLQMYVNIFLSYTYGYTFNISLTRYIRACKLWETYPFYERVIALVGTNLSAFQDFQYE